MGAIIGTYLGLSGIPDKYKSGLDRTGAVFSNSGYTFNGVIAVCESLARDAVRLRGGTIAPDGADELWTIPADAAQPLPLETWPGSGDDTPSVSISLHRDQAQWNKVTLVASASDGDGIASIHWFFGDLSYQSGSSLSHTYSAKGQYEIVAYATDGGGNTGWSSVTVSLHPGDLDRSGGVNIVDLNMVLIDWGKTGSFVDPRSDSDGSGTVDIIDLNTVLVDWGK